MYLKIAGVQKSGIKYYSMKGIIYGKQVTKKTAVSGSRWDAAS